VCASVFCGGAQLLTNSQSALGLELQIESLQIAAVITKTRLGLHKNAIEHASITKTEFVIDYSGCQWHHRHLPNNHKIDSDTGKKLVTRL